MEPADLERMVAWARTRSLPNIPKHCHAVWRKRRVGCAAQRPSQQALVQEKQGRDGDIELDQIAWRAPAELRMHRGKAYWNQGLGTDRQAVVAHAFET